MKIAHLSDLHICGINKPENLEKTEKLIIDALHQGTGHFVFSGDISHDASVLDFKLLRKLLLKYNLFNARKSSIIIGNHDIFGGVHFATDILTYPAKIRKVNFAEKVYQFEDVFRDLFDGSTIASVNSFFPFAKIINDFLIIGINSIMEYSKIRNPMAANGKINTEDYFKIKDLLLNLSGNIKNKVVLIHHHFIGRNFFEKRFWWSRIENYTMKIYGKNKLLKIFQKAGVDLVLHGHVHQNYQYNLKGVKFLNAGGAIENDKDNKIRYNLIDFNESGLNIQTKILSYQKNAISDAEIMEQLIPSFVS